MRSVMIIGLLLLPFGTSTAQTQGAVVIRVPDGAASRCVDASRDRVWVTLRRLITTRSQGWFSVDRSVAVLINATVRTEPAHPRPLKFPLITEARLGGHGTGQVSVPLEFTLVDGFYLRQGDVNYTGVTLELTLLNQREPNAWGTALSSLNEIAKKLPLPPSPVSQFCKFRGGPGSREPRGERQGKGCRIVAQF
jgi:hypothetical protein